MNLVKGSSGSGILFVVMVMVVVMVVMIVTFMVGVVGGDFLNVCGHLVNKKSDASENDIQCLVHTSIASKHGKRILGDMQ